MIFEFVLLFIIPFLVALIFIESFYLLKATRKLRSNSEDKPGPTPLLGVVLPPRADVPGKEEN